MLNFSQQTDAELLAIIEPEEVIVIEEEEVKEEEIPGVEEPTEEITSKDDEVIVEEVSKDKEVEDTLSEDSASIVKEDKTEVKEEVFKDVEADQVNFEDAYKEIFEPYKANGSMHTAKSVEEIRKLMSLGSGYHANMNKAQPYIRIGKSLEAAGLLDETKLNTLIEASKGSKEALMDIIKQNKIDVNDLSVDEFSTDEDKKVYVPKDNILSESEMTLQNTVDELSTSPTYNKTMQLVSKDWDSSSKAQIASHPHILKVIDMQMQNGDFDKITAEINHLRIFGNIPDGMSDLDVYGTVAKSLEDRKEETKKPKAPKETSFDKTRLASSTGKPPVKKQDTLNKPYNELSDKELDELISG